MKILFLTVSDQKNQPLGKFTDLHCNFDFSSWEIGFHKICPQVMIFDYYESFAEKGPLEMERKVSHLVRANSIELVVIPNMYFELLPTFLNQLRKLGCRSLVVFFDDSMRFDEVNRFYLNACDFYLTHESASNKALYRSFGIDAEFFPFFPSFSFYNKVLQGFDRGKFRMTADVVFVGANIADRETFIQYLVDNGVAVAVYGSGWEAGKIATAEMLAAYNSAKISLNFVKTIDNSGRLQLKGRLFEIIMAGGFILSEHSDEFSDFFEIGAEIDTFRTQEELLYKVKYYLSNPHVRLNMAKRAQKKVIEQYSFETSWQGFLFKIESGLIKSVWPNTGYKVSNASVNNFLNWNLGLVFGRIRLSQLSLAGQQVFWCCRELWHLRKSISVGRYISKWVLCRIKGVAKKVCVRLVSLLSYLFSFRKES